MPVVLPSRLGLCELIMGYHCMLEQLQVVLQPQQPNACALCLWLAPLTIVQFAFLKWRWFLHCDQVADNISASCLTMTVRERHVAKANRRRLLITYYWQLATALQSRCSVSYLTISCYNCIPILICLFVDRWGICANLNLGCNASPQRPMRKAQHTIENHLSVLMTERQQPSGRSAVKSMQCESCSSHRHRLPLQCFFPHQGLS
jgi:hypothetical protein